LDELADDHRVAAGGRRTLICSAKYTLKAFKPLAGVRRASGAPGNLGVKPLRPSQEHGEQAELGRGRKNAAACFGLGQTPVEGNASLSADETFGAEPG